jgi:hypothetical protein
VKGEFKPVDIVITSAEPAQSGDTISQVLPIVPVTEEPLHEATEAAKEVEIYAPPVEAVVEQGKELEPQYSSWDASKSVAAAHLNFN